MSSYTPSFVLALSIDSANRKVRDAEYLWASALRNGCRDEITAASALHAAAKAERGALEGARVVPG